MDSGRGNRRRMATVGMFDGVHLGHRFLLDRLVEESCLRGLEPMVFTFSAHPLDLIAPDSSPRLLTTAGQRVRLIGSHPGIGCVEVLSPDSEFLALSGRRFLDSIRHTHGVDAFMMGFNNRIGCDRAGAADLSMPDFPVVEAPAMPSDISAPVSSTLIRRAIDAGDFDSAHRALGRVWHYRGRVVQGKQLGRTIGFPTANIEPVEPRQLMPADGVYAVDVCLPDGSVRRGMANIGHRPTVDSPSAPRSFEVNIFDFEGDLYGSVVDVAFCGLIRRERAFASIEDLRHQLCLDREAARRM